LNYRILIREGDAPTEPALHCALNDIGERFREGEAPTEPVFVNMILLIRAHTAVRPPGRSPAPIRQ
jgi:hypothetical protein